MLNACIVALHEPGVYKLIYQQSRTV